MIRPTNLCSGSSGANTTAIKVGRAVSEIFLTVWSTLSPPQPRHLSKDYSRSDYADIQDSPPDGTLISTLYKVVGEATEGHYVSEHSCDYTLAKTFLQKVQWDGLTSADMVQLVSDTFKSPIRLVVMDAIVIQRLRLPPCYWMICTVSRQMPA